MKKQQQNVSRKKKNKKKIATTKKKMNSTKVQNPRHKLDDKCLCLSYVFSSVLACAKFAHVFQKLSSRFAVCPELVTLPQTVRLFYVSLHPWAPKQQYTVHCMHYGHGITLWAYLSEPLGHKHLSFGRWQV